MGVENLREEVLTAMENKPKWSRKGQFVFNYINEHYGVARIAQFKYGIDCFYRDDKIDEFIECCINILKSKLC